MLDRCISENEAQRFAADGYLIVPGVIVGEELLRLQLETGELVEYGRSQVREDPDYAYGVGHKSGGKVLRRIEYVIDKRDSCKALLGNPFVLRSVERLMGADLIPTWDAMVLKMPGEGIVVPWHRDAGTGCVGDQPIFNVDYYLDRAGTDNCVWVIPGSHLWEEERVKHWLAERAADNSEDDFKASGAVPALMEPGDILFHNILLLHGSPAGSSEQLRRVIYYEFRTAHVEERLGPHTPAYIPVKQKELLACIKRRKAAAYVAAEEEPYVYAPPAPYNAVSLGVGEEPATYRFPHGEYWRPTAWSPAESLRVRSVTQVRVSPDGLRAAFVVRDAIMTDTESEYRTQIWLGGPDCGSHQATFGAKSSGNPQWSPDGRWLAFTSERSGRSQLYRMHTTGGEAEPLTDEKGSVGDYAWSPDGARIAFLMADPKSPEEESQDKKRDDSFWVNENLKPAHLHTIALEQREPGPRSPTRLTSGTFHISGFDWSPDGASIAYAHQITPSANDWVTSSISGVALTDCVSRPIVDGPACAIQPHYSPDGKTIAYSQSQIPTSWAEDFSICAVDVAGREPRQICSTPDGSPGLIGWSADGSQIYFMEAAGTRAMVAAANAVTGAIERLDANDNLYSDISLNTARTHFGCAAQSTGTPIEACIAGLDFRPTVISSVNASQLDLPLGPTEIIRWSSSDGAEIEGLLTYPVGYQSGNKVPLLLMVHGGPAGVYMENYTAAPSNYPVASFAARGYAVLRCNPRGSSGYGAAFRRANRKDWGGGDYHDLMFGVDHVIELGVADPERMGVMGWSYGGFMTSWIITQTNRFKAASVGAGVTNLMSFNGTADIPAFVPDYFGAQAWEDPALYAAHSPMFQVANVTTPTLIQHGESDVRVPVSQGYELYNALRTRGIETRMIVLPRQPHGPNEPRMQLKVMETNLDWFDSHLKPTS